MRRKEIEVQCHVSGIVIIFYILDYFLARKDTEEIFDFLS